ncbi:MAG TPA: sugar ABC transporter ATP-binding protein [Erysipelothrix sp.]|nr:sugar ABC transporter ATP-binding protein [Erysipelothrix sp.]
MTRVVKMRDIHKSFPGVHALKGVSLNLYEGEVMALLGENGAGKSTLMKILGGVHQRDKGTLEVFEQEIGELNPRSAMEHGISIIHQELNLCNHLSVAENIFLGREISKNGRLLQSKMNEIAQSILDDLNVDIKATDIIGELSVSKQQMVEIAKSLSMDAKIIIMDEPTSALSFKEIEELFRIINELKAKGTSIVYISHKLEELAHIVDRVTILRDGEFIEESFFNDIDIEHIITRMVGREIKEKFPTIQRERGDIVLEVEALNAGHLVRDISFNLYAGEIVGIAGLVGSGRTELTRALFGVDPKESGTVKLYGADLNIKSPMDSIKAGLVLAPEDRKQDGLCTKLSIRENITLSNLDIISNKLGVINRKKEKAMCDTAVLGLGIKISSLEANADSLSGGNQQKVVVAKWLSRESNVVIFDEPTRGIDVAAKVEIYRLMNELKENGAAVLFASSEMPEVLGISDRVLVMCDGRITADLITKETNQNEIMRYATQFEDKRAGLEKGIA